MAVAVAVAESRRTARAGLRQRTIPLELFKLLHAQHSAADRSVAPKAFECRCCLMSPVVTECIEVAIVNEFDRFGELYDETCTSGLLHAAITCTIVQLIGREALSSQVAVIRSLPNTITITVAQLVSSQHGSS